MEPNRRFSIFTFPQYFDGKTLTVNIVYLPRNQNPLSHAIEGEPLIPDGRPFADAKLSFVAKIITGLADLPGVTPSVAPIPLVTPVPGFVRPLFEALAGQFTITNLGASNTNFNINNFPHKAPEPVPPDQSVNKYLPLSYRRSFNFVAPRTRNAVTNDAYFCAVRDAKSNAAFQQSPETISWGKVFAHAMRQPLLAEALGMIYKTELTIDASWFPKGGWLYVDMADGSDYHAQQTADDTFIRRYAARIPELVPGNERTIFAPILFPVQAVPTPGNYDRIFIEAADFDDGFCKIVHGFQPVSDNMLAEESDGFHPTKEAGIRLGWDDEQILIWYMRQLSEDDSVGPKKRIEAPLGVFGYRIDVRQHPAATWESLNEVTNRIPLMVIDPASKKEIPLGDFKGRELNYQVYPAQIDGNAGKNYWLPMYFANWNGKSMVLPDDDATSIYQHDDVLDNSRTNVKSGPVNANNNLNKLYAPTPITTTLRYGALYDFRVRLADMSGGGPDANHEPTNHVASQIATVHFKRFVAPNAPRISRLPVNTEDGIFHDAEITLKRPLLGYPAVVFTGKYQEKGLDPVMLLKQASIDMAGQEAFGIADPDVDRVEITVEVQTLKMDNLMSVSGKEAYIKFYTTTRTFPKSSPGFEDELAIPLKYKDCNILRFGDTGNLGDLGVTQDEIDALEQLVLPTARTIRLTLRAVCEKKSNYYGLEQADAAFNTRYGRTAQFLLHKESADEKNLFVNTSDVKKFNGIYLQPDPPFVFNGNPLSLLFGKKEEKAPEMIQRLAQQLGLENKGLTLVGKKGRRVQFGCSQRIRHTLSPDNSSLTFAGKGDLANHWLCCITLELDRDWTWDGLKDRSLVIQRQQLFLEDGLENDPVGGKPKVDKAPKVEVGDLEIKKTAPFSALIGPDRSGVTLIFIDAVEPKKDASDLDPDFPATISVKYTVQPQFKQDYGANYGELVIPALTLPITLPPAQVPKIVSAGIALSPYWRSDNYSTTEPRRRQLWIELAEPIRDLKDTCFARVLSYAPDQLISNNHPELLVAPEDSALLIDAESIRVVTYEQPHDYAGLDAMQMMEKATNSETHYLLPLPPGLHAESPEMFGFFTYEFRVGHYQYPATNQHVWTTAQARFGRALRTTGVQHPAPTLTCTANRDKEKVSVSAPYAVAVQGGKNVTSDPPRTQLWALLYAQVKQADNKDFRNVLLDDRQLDWRVRVEHEKSVDWNTVYDKPQLNILKQVAIKNWNVANDIGQLAHVHKIMDYTSINRDATKYGTAIWTNDEINGMLGLYGLPLDSPLSVLCVELLPQITKISEHISGIDDLHVRENLRSLLSTVDLKAEGTVREWAQPETMRSESISIKESKPLSDELGDHRILRTSPLAMVPFVCCTQC
jgi:hypothetical protein